MQNKVDKEKIWRETKNKGKKENNKKKRMKGKI